MVCPHCGQYITVNDAAVVYPGTVNPTAANPMPSVRFYPTTAAAAAVPPTLVIHNANVGG